MSLKRRFQIKGKQRIKRRQNRAKIKKQGSDPNKFYYNNYYLKEKGE